MGPEAGLGLLGQSPAVLDPLEPFFRSYAHGDEATSYDLWGVDGREGGDDLAPRGREEAGAMEVQVGLNELASAELDY